MRKQKEIMIGDKLKALRKSYGYTQEKLSEAIECSTRYIGNIEQDKSKPSYEVLVKICNVFHIGTDTIFGEYLDKTTNKSQDLGLAGFEKLKPENQEMILHLIEYFNRNNRK